MVRQRSHNSPRRYATGTTLGIRHRVLGRVPERRALLVANHVSWIDTLVVLANPPAHLLAKHEVGEWPIIGRVARTLGTVFVDRTRPKALPATVREVAGVLAADGVVAVSRRGRRGAAERLWERPFRGHTSPP